MEIKKLSFSTSIWAGFDKKLKVKICKMNVDEAPETPATLGIRSIPSLMMFKDGKLIDSKVGLNSKSNVVEWILANA